MSFPAALLCTVALTELGRGNGTAPVISLDLGAAQAGPGTAHRMQDRAIVPLSATAFNRKPLSPPAGTDRRRQAKNSAPTRVKLNVTGLGELEGRRSGNVEEFLGIPFAVPPLGERRWAAPHRSQPWKGVLDATQYSPNCMQTIDPGNPNPDAQVSEDCLYLNVYRPAGATKAAPVLFWIFGGGFTMGGGNETRLLGGFNVELVYPAPYIIVTTNYRLGIFGYLGSDELRDSTGSSGNWATMDQRLALKWTRDHIAAFGGDPDRIMMAGQSAGAASVSCHLVSKKSWGLAKRAGMMSGAFPTWIVQTWDDAIASYASLLNATKCADAGCLRALSAKTVWDLGDVVSKYGFGPTVDGVELPARPWELAQRGHVDPHIDTVIAGNTAEDGGSPVSCFGDRASFEAWVERDVFPNNATLFKEVIALYPAAGDQGRVDDGSGCGEYFWTARHFLRDAEMACPARRTGYWLTYADVYLFQFNHVAIWQPPSEGSSHSSDIPFLFHVTKARDGDSERVRQQQVVHGNEEIVLSATMARAWYAIAATGQAPLDLQAKGWVPYTNTTQSWVVWDSDDVGGVHVVRDLHKRQCDWWDRYIALAPTG